MGDESEGRVILSYISGEKLPRQNNGYYTYTVEESKDQAIKGTYSHAEGRETIACGVSYESLSRAMEQVSKAVAQCGASLGQVTEAMRQSMAAGFTPVTNIASISKKLPQPEFSKEKKEEVFKLVKKFAEEKTQEKEHDSFELPAFDIDKYKIDLSEEAYSFDFEPHLSNLFDF